MNMKKITLTILTLSAAFLASCDGDRYELQTMVPEEYHRILSFAGMQLDEATLYITGNENHIPVKVLKGGSDPSLSSYAWLEPLTNDELKDYGTQYQIIPEGLYTIERNIEFTPDQKAKEVNVVFSGDQTVKLQKFCESLPDGVMPCIAMRLVPGEGTSVYSDKSVVIRTIEITEPYMVASCSAEIPFISGLSSYTMLPVAGLSDLPSISLTLAGNLENSWSIKCTAKYRKDLVAEYNEKNGTSYQALEEGVVTLDSEITLAPGSGTAEFLLKKTSEPEGAGLYLYPIEFTTDKFSIDGLNKDNILYLLLTSEVRMGEDNVSSPATADYDGIGISGLFDNTSSFWHTTYQDGEIDGQVYDYYEDEIFGHYFDIRLDTPITHAFRFDYWIRTGYDPWRSAPSKLNIYYSNAEDPGSAEDWTLIRTLTREEDSLPYLDHGDRYSSGIFNLSDFGIEQIRHIRFSATEVLSGDNYDEVVIPGVCPGHICLSEFKMWGN